MNQITPYKIALAIILVSFVDALYLGKVICGELLCDSEEYCAEVSNTCQSCYIVCNQNGHNYDPAICEERCQVLKPSIVEKILTQYVNELNPSVVKRIFTDYINGLSPSIIKNPTNRDILTISDYFILLGVIIIGNMIAIFCWKSMKIIFNDPMKCKKMFKRSANNSNELTSISTKERETCINEPNPGITNNNLQHSFPPQKVVNL